MANYATLKAAIADVIKTNGNNAITGALLQQELLAMVDSLGVGYQFMGVALPTDNPGTPDQRVFYFGGPGVYPNFGNLSVGAGEFGFFFYNTNWSVSTFAIDDNVQRLQAELSKLKEDLGFETTEKPYNDTILSAYLNGGYIVGWSGHDLSLIKIYPVTRGDTMLIKQADGFLSAGEVSGNSYAAAGFMTAFPEIGDQYAPVLMGSVNEQAINWVAPDDGYLICWCRDGIGRGRETSAFVQTDVWPYSEILDGLPDQLQALEDKDQQLEDEIATVKEQVGIENVDEPMQYDSTLTSCYPVNGTIVSWPNHDLSLLLVYPVISGQQYKIKQPAGFASQGEVNNRNNAAIFSETQPAIGDVCTSVLVVSVDAQEYLWTAPSNGYLCCWCRDGVGGGRSTTAYISEEKWIYKDMLDNLPTDFIDKIYPLMGKTVAILGDSIMQNMCTPNVPTNVTTFKDITGVDPTEYTVDDITIINGYIYLTSSLDGGEIGPNTIRLRPVNSGQAEIDHKRWYDLENKLKTADLFVLGMGGGRIVEQTNKIITAYPARHTSGILDGKMEDLPNQIRQLLRVVNEGVHNAPDCVIIWMGVNGADTVITDTFEEAFAIDWEILSDDQLGYEYRTKFYGAMRYAIESIYRAFPFATIFILSPAQNSRGDEKIDGSGYAYRGFTSLKAVSDAMRLIAGRYACVFVDALQEMGLANFSYRANATLSGNEISTGVRLGNLVPTFLNDVNVDGLHPNATGKILWENFLTTHLRSSYYPKKD